MANIADNKKCALIVFAKEPKRGKVKTRLQKDLPVHHVVNLYKAFVKDVLTSIRNIHGCDCFIYYAGNSSSIPFLKSISRSFTLKRQRGQDLGQKMYSAFSDSQKLGYGKTVIIGTDCLDIRKTDIIQAFKKLDKYDCVLGPAVDGGYYLIGTTCIHKRYFKGVSWSSGSVLHKTLINVKGLKQKVFMLSKKEDIDNFNTLKKLKVRLSCHTVYTKKYLKEIAVFL